MSLLTFIKKFPNEQICRDYLAQKRWGGLDKAVCPFFGHKHCYSHNGIDRFTCKQRQKQFSLRINTIFEDSRLAKNQIKIANTCGVPLSALAKVDIQTLIDEATGFQYDKKNDVLLYLLKQYIAEGLQKWIKTFPDDFRLYENGKNYQKYQRKSRRDTGNRY